MKVALTGGIGAGKSYVCRLLEQRGIQVYDCDAAAKRLIRSSTEIRQALTQLVGDGVYKDGILQKQMLARFITADASNACAVNDIVHPAVADDFVRSGKEWIESAIFFDSGFNKRVKVDCVVCVAAPEDMRIDRVMKRDNITREMAQAWIARQLPQEVVMAQSDYVIVNDGQQNLEQQIDEIIKKIRKL